MALRRRLVNQSERGTKTTKMAHGRRRSKFLLILGVSVCCCFMMMTVVFRDGFIPTDQSTNNKPKHNLNPTDHSTNKKLKLNHEVFPPRTIHVEYKGDTVRMIRQRSFDTHREEQKKEDQGKDKRMLDLSSHEMKARKYIEKSRHYKERDPLYEGECVPMQPWQETSFPSCNSFHELDPYGSALIGNFGHLASGGYNDVFLYEGSEKLVMKELTYGTDYTDRNFDRVRRDALIMERLTASSYIVDIHGHCGFAIFVPYAPYGTLSDEIWEWRRGRKKVSSRDRLKYALHVSAALAAFHDIDGEGLSSVTHGDLKGSQFVVMNGTLTMGDFNRGRFLRRNATSPKTACPYTIGKNDGKYRAPEEYKYIPETSAIDVWAMGSIIYELLTGTNVWDGYERGVANKKTIAGELPPISKSLKNSNSLVNKLLIEAIDLCYVYDPKERATAKQVYEHLKQGWEKYEGLDDNWEKEKQNELQQNLKQFLKKKRVEVYKAGEK